MKNNIIIETDLTINENPQNNDSIKEGKDSNEKDSSENIKNIESKEIQAQKVDINNPNNITETEQNNNANNSKDISQNNSNLTNKQENNDTIKDNLNEDIQSKIEKDDKGENLEKNEDIKKEDDTYKKEENILIPRIIEESEDYSPIEDILQERQNKNNILNNNQIYFTEANTLIPREYTDTKDIKDIKKSNSNKLYTLTSIPEYSNIKIKKTAETPLKIKSINSQDKTKNKSICLNNLSPEVYMKKKFRVNKEKDLICLKVRIKQIEEEILKRNEYDYKSAMKECKLLYMKDIKNKEKEKQIIEENKKFEEKLKNMEEYRNNLINNRIKKILQRQSGKNRNKKNLDINNKSLDNNLIEIPIKEKMEKINNEKILKTLDSYDEKLPILPGMHKYEILKMIKDKEEKNFCINTEQRLKDLEKSHRKNYLKHLRKINEKLAKQNELYNIRSEKCITESKERSGEFEQNYIAKEMLKRFNIKQNLLRDISEKKEKIKGNLLKNIENVKEKKELLIKQEQQKIKKIIKRLNRQKSLEVKQNLLNENVNNLNNHRIYFSNLQKENLNKANKEEKDYYNELILRQEDYFWIIRNLQKDESTNRIIIQKALQNQNKKDNEMKSLNKFLEKMDRNNINNQKNGTKMKLFLEQRKIEISNKKKEEEEVLENQE